MHDFTKIVIAIFVIAALALGGYFVYEKFFKSEIEEALKTETTEAVSIPDEILNNKYGFLTGHPGSEKEAKEFGARWVRPHTGPFLWDAMQENSTAEFDFELTDEIVKDNQNLDLATLVTLWPFADWDQKQKANPEQYKVSEEDEFLQDENEKGEKGNYLPLYRSNPYDWKAYQTWIKAVIERYDGDGENDMPGLKIPVKYWEVINEPDLTSPDEEEDSLCFYKEGPEEYATLLIKTNQAIKEADSGAKVLIAGAAGGSNQFVDFYRDVFKNKDAVKAFDIGNVHCISNDNFDSLNVEPYKELLAEFKINKPIWVTEAETMISEDADINASQLHASVKKALSLGAKKFFFTSRGFEMDMKPGGEGPKMPEELSEGVEKTLDGSNAKAAYLKITKLK